MNVDVDKTWLRRDTKEKKSERKENRNKGERERRIQMSEKGEIKRDRDLCFKNGAVDKTEFITDPRK